MVRVAVGQTLAEGETIACVVPDHEGRGRIERKRDGRLVYRCDCDRIERSLTEVYIARVTGAKYKRSKQAFMLWRLRHAALAEILCLPAVDLPALPEPLPASAGKVYAGLRLLLRVRQLTDQADEATFTFARGFAAEWTGISRDEAKSGIDALVSTGLLVVVGKQILENGREANLYRLGPVRA